MMGGNKNSLAKQVAKGLLRRFMGQAAWKLVLWGIGSIVGLGWPFILFLVMIGIVVMLAGSFMFGSFTGVTLSPDQQKYTVENAQLKQIYSEVAAQWQNGLDAQQQSIVRSYQLYMPASVLLTMGKFADNNYSSSDQQSLAEIYYNLLKPEYTWVKGDEVTTHRYWASRPATNGTVKGKPGRYIAVKVTHKTVWELRKANTWDGIFSSTWGTKVIGGFSAGVGTQVVEPYMTSETMTYEHNLFYAAAAQYGFQKSDVNPLWYDAIYSMQMDEYTNQHDQYAYLDDPKVMQWGPVYGIGMPPSPPTGGSAAVENPQQVQRDISQALEIDVPYGIPRSWAPYIFEVVGHESGGNKNDVNPQAVEYSPGVYEHAEGIMQTMPSTFAEYAVPGHTDIWNPVDNIAAAMRYILSTYKSPLSINGIGNSLPYQGY